MNPITLIEELSNPLGRVSSVTINAALYVKNIEFFSTHMVKRCCGKPSLLVGYSFNVVPNLDVPYKVIYE